MSRKILVVDDEANILLSLEYLLSEAGFAVRLAKDGDEALDAAQADAPDLVLLDVMMPKKDGYDVCQQLRASPKFARTRIVMLSAKSRQIEREKGLAMGADAYLAKPFSSQELLDCVHEQLSGA